MTSVMKLYSIMNTLSATVHPDVGTSATTKWSPLRHFLQPFAGEERVSACPPSDHLRIDRRFDGRRLDIPISVLRMNTRPA